MARARATRAGEKTFRERLEEITNEELTRFLQESPGEYFKVKVMGDFIEESQDIETINRIRKEFLDIVDGMVISCRERRYVNGQRPYDIEWIEDHIIMGIKDEWNIDQDQFVQYDLRFIRSMLNNKVIDARDSSEDEEY